MSDTQADESQTPVNRTQEQTKLLVVQRRRTPYTSDPFEVEEKNLPKVDTIKGSDLLIDVATTTAIASLTNGTPVLGISDALSYICFLALTWWIWASQVLYNVRFRQRDWLHHGFVILQLLTLCALAAFSGGFDISQGIVSDTEPADMPSLASNTQFFISGSSAIVDARSNFLSRVNSTGISCVLLCSRVLILLQYCRVWSCAERSNNTHKDAFSNAARAHVIAISISAILYIISIAVVRSDKEDVTRGHSIGKIILWILPIFLEFFTHCFVDKRYIHSVVAKDTKDNKDVADQKENWERKQAKGIMLRADSVFIILMGVGLDRITKSFQLISGNVIVDGKSAILVISAGIIYVTQLTLYFNLKKYIGGRTNHYNVLWWYFINFFNFAALILTLQATAALLELGNLVKALDLPLRIVYTFGDAIRSFRNQHIQLIVDEFSSLRPPLARIGISLDNMVFFLNNGSNYFTLANATGDQITGYLYAYTRILGVVSLQTLLRNLDQYPDPGSVLDIRMLDIVSCNFLNPNDLSTRATKEAFGHTLLQVRTDHAEPTEWFFGFAGATLLMQFVLWWILHPDWYGRSNEDPRKPLAYTFERWIQGLRLSFGVATIFLSIICTNTSYPPNQFSTTVREYTFHDTMIHELGQNGWILGVFALIILIEQVLEQLLETHTTRSDLQVELPTGKPEGTATIPPQTEQKEIVSGGQGNVGTVEGVTAGMAQIVPKVPVSEDQGNVGPVGGKNNSS